MVTKITHTLYIMFMRAVDTQIIFLLWNEIVVLEISCPQYYLSTRKTEKHSVAHAASSAEPAGYWFQSWGMDVTCDP